MMEIQRGFDVIGGGGKKPVVVVVVRSKIGSGREVEEKAKRLLRFLNKIWRSGEERKREEKKGEEVLKKRRYLG